MNLNTYFKSVLEMDKAPVLICDLSHNIIYMNPAAIREYKMQGGEALLGKNVLDCHNSNSAEVIKKVVRWFEESINNNRVHTFYGEKSNKDVYMVALRDEKGSLIGYYEKHEFRTKDETPFYQL